MESVDKIACEVIDWLDYEFKWKTQNIEMSKKITKSEILKITRGNTIPVWQFLMTYIKSRK